MKTQLIKEVQRRMLPYLNNEQLQNLHKVLEFCLHGVEVSLCNEMQETTQVNLTDTFIIAKRIEGCSEKTIRYYRKTY